MTYHCLRELNFNSRIWLCLAVSQMILVLQPATCQKGVFFSLIRPCIFLKVETVLLICRQVPCLPGVFISHIFFAN